LCLHGNDMNTELTPIESGLMWTVRKQDIATPFIGQETLWQKKEVSFLVIFFEVQFFKAKILT